MNETSANKAIDRTAYRRPVMADVGHEEMITIMSAIALVLGGLLASFNWYSIYASRKSGRFVSAVPLIGAALLVVGFLGIPQTRPYAWLGIIIDYGTLALIMASPRLMREAWLVSSVNLLHGHYRPQQRETRRYSPLQKVHFHNPMRTRTRGAMQ